jgi:hypothetical protein
MSFSQITIGVDVLVFVSVYVLHRSSSFLVHLIYIVKHFAIVSIVPQQNMMYLIQKYIEPKSLIFRTERSIYEYMIVIVRTVVAFCGMYANLHLCVSSTFFYLTMFWF